MLSEEQKNNPELLMQIIQEYGKDVEYREERWHTGDTNGIVHSEMEKINDFKEAVKILMDRTKGKPEQYINTIKQYPYAALVLVEEARSNKEIVCDALKKYGRLAFEYTSNELKKDPEVIRAVYGEIKCSHEDLWYEPPEYINIGGVDKILLANYGIGYEFIDSNPILMRGRTKIAREDIDYNRANETNRLKLEETIMEEQEIPTRIIDTLVINCKGRTYHVQTLKNTDGNFNKILNNLDMQNIEGEQATLFFDSEEYPEGIPIEIIPEDYSDGYPGSLMNISGVTGKLYKEAGGIIPEDYQQYDDNYDATDIYYSRTKLVYNTSLSPEINEELLLAYFHSDKYYYNCPLIDPDFIKYHLTDLIECFDGKDGLINFVKKYGEADRNNDVYCLYEYDNFEQYIEELSKSIDDAIRHKGKNPYTSSEIVEAIDTREKELGEVIEETEDLARPNNREENIEQDGQTQADE